MTATAPLLSLESVGKTYDGFAALTASTFTVMPGSIHGLVGVNGAGKSTLVKIIAGFIAPDSGAAGLSNGRGIDFPIVPERHGIAVIHQDLGLVEDMTALEHIGLPQLYGGGLFTPIRWRSERRLAHAAMERLDVDLDLDRPVTRLGPAERATVAILRAMRQLDAHRKDGDRALLVMDEPTSYLSGADAARVMRLIRDVRANGDSVVLVTHHLKEVIEVCDTVTVLRSGRVVASQGTDGMDEKALVALMLGRELVDFYPPKPTVARGERLLRATRLVGEMVAGVDLDAYGGEVLGVTGLIGMGHEELPYLLAGYKKPSGGTVEGPGGRRFSDVATAQASGVALVPGDRLQLSLDSEFSARESLALPVVSKLSRLGTVSARRELAHVSTLMQMFNVDPPDPARNIRAFSGGNQQKVALARWLQLGTDVVLLDEPTNGVDAGARREIVKLLDQVAESGRAVVIFSSDLELLASACHRVVVLDRGRTIAEVSGDDVTDDELHAWVNSGAGLRHPLGATTPVQPSESF